MAPAKTAFICLALLAAAWAVTEVQELGNDDSHLDNHESANLSAEDDDDSVGEAAGTGRRGGGGFLSTTTSPPTSPPRTTTASARLPALAVAAAVASSRLRVPSRSPLA